MNKNEFVSPHRYDFILPRQISMDVWECHDSIAIVNGVETGIGFTDRDWAMKTIDTVRSSKRDAKGKSETLYNLWWMETLRRELQNNNVIEVIVKPDDVYFTYRTKDGVIERAEMNLCGIGSTSCVNIRHSGAVPHPYLHLSSCNYKPTIEYMVPHEESEIYNYRKDVVYETVMNGTAVDVMIPGRLYIDYKLGEQLDKEREEELLMQNYKKQSKLYKSIIIIGTICLWAVFLCLYKTLKMTALSILITSFVSCIMQFVLCMISLFCDYRANKHAHNKRVAEIYGDYISDMSKVHHIFQTRQVLEMTMAPNEYAVECITIKYKMSNGFVDDRNITLLNHQFFPMNIKESTEITRPCVRFEIDPLRIIYTEPCRKDR